MIRSHKHILHIGINDIGTMVSQEKHLFPSLLECLSIRIKMDSDNNLHFFNDWAQQIHSYHRDK